jgi:hypothetical protein
MFWALTEMFHVRQHESFMLYNMKLLWQLRYLKIPYYLTQFFYCVRNEVIFRGACTSWGVMRIRETFLTAIFVFTITNLSGNDFQTIMLW